LSLTVLTVIAMKSSDILFSCKCIK